MRATYLGLHEALNRADEAGMPPGAAARARAWLARLEAEGARPPDALDLGDAARPALRWAQRGGREELRLSLGAAGGAKADLVVLARTSPLGRTELNVWEYAGGELAAHERHVQNPGGPARRVGRLPPAPGGAAAWPEAPGRGVRWAIIRLLGGSEI